MCALRVSASSRLVGGAGGCCARGKATWRKRSRAVFSLSLRASTARSSRQRRRLRSPTPSSTRHSNACPERTRPVPGTGRVPSGRRNGWDKPNESPGRPRRSTSGTWHQTWLFWACLVGAAGVEEERRRDAAVVAEARRSARVLLERLDVQPGARECAHDLADPPQPVRIARVAEVVATPTEKSVHTICDGMVVEDEELAGRAQRRRDTGRPAVEVTEPFENAFAGVDEIEAASAELARQRLRVTVHPEDLRPPFACRLERGRLRVDPRRDRPELGERRRGLARSAQQMQDALALQVAERALNKCRQLDRLGAGTVRVVPGPEVLVGRLHRASYAPSE